MIIRKDIHWAALSLYDDYDGKILDNADIDDDDSDDYEGGDDEMDFADHNLTI